MTTNQPNPAPPLPPAGVVEQPARDLVHPDNEGFRERVTPKSPQKDVIFYKCNGCNGIHFRHAGYVEVMLPFMRAGNEKRVGIDSISVKICVKCKRSWVWINEQVYEVTDQIDLAAWEKTEREAHAATGPGGQC